MKKTNYICDYCGNDITATDSMPRTRLILGYEWMEHKSNLVYSVLVHPPLDGIMAFCNLNCLLEWAKSKVEAKYGK